MPFKDEATAKAYRIKNAERRRETTRLWRERNQEADKQRTKDWGQTPDGKEKKRNNHYKHKYNITLDDYNKMLDEQSHSCKICNSHKDLFKKALCVDHCHSTGKIRGLLCDDCNVGLGKYKDQEELMIKAANYLRESRNNRVPEPRATRQ
jgi:hypothetical protein